MWLVVVSVSPLALLIDPAFRLSPELLERHKFQRSVERVSPLTSHPCRPSRVSISQSVPNTARWLTTRSHLLKTVASSVYCCQRSVSSSSAAAEAQGGDITAVDSVRSRGDSAIAG
jgi:hypothetical protein